MLRLLTASTAALACTSHDSTSAQGQTVSDAGAAGQDGAGGGPNGAGGIVGAGGGGGAGGLTLKDTLCDGIPNGGNGPAVCGVGCYEPGDTCFVQYGAAGGPSKNVCVLDGGPTPITICGGPDGGSDGGPCEPFDAGVVSIPDGPCLLLGDPKLASALSPFGPVGFGPSIQTGPMQTVGSDGGVACCYGVVYAQTGRPLPGWAHAPLVRRTGGWAVA